MNRKTAKIIAIVVAVAMVITSMSFIVFLPAYFGMEGYVAYGATTTVEQESINAELDALEKYIKYLRDNYKDEIDYKTMLDGAFEGVTNSLGDKYSDYYSDAEEGQSFVESVNGEYEGIGVTISLIDGKCTIISVTKNSPAYNSGLKADDVITMIDGKKVSTVSLNEAAAGLKGKEGTTVKVTILRDGTEKTYPIVRAKIRVECVSYEMLDGKIGYIELSGFDDDADREFTLALEALLKDGAKSLIIDVRDNPGGLISMAIDIADLILKSGDIVHLKVQGKYIEKYSAEEKYYVDVPIAMLINENSASATEILAGALKDNKAATLVGTTTYGKGVAQQMIVLDNTNSAKVSVFYFLTPNKSDIHNVGITPDYVVRNSAEGSEELFAQYSAMPGMLETDKPKLGDVGLNVYGAQLRLDFLGYDVEATGMMDQVTMNAIQKFQREQGLSPYATLDYTTMKTLDSVAYNYATQTSDKDLQLEKAIELLK